MDLIATLKKHFGYEQFRPLQEEIIRDALAGRDVYLARIETLAGEMMKDPGVRLPGTRRRELAARHQVTGITIPDALATEVERLAG